MSYLLLIGGLILLGVGAEALIRGSSRLAVAVGISPLIVGLTVVAFATSSPELAVGIDAVMEEEADIAVGNIVGSNILNILVIIGLSAVFVPLAVAQRLIRVDVPVMIAISLAVLLLSRDGEVGRLEGGIALAILGAYLLFVILESRSGVEPEAVKQEYEREYGRDSWGFRSVGANLFLIAAGLLVLVLGSRWLVSGATDIAEDLGLSQLIIGLTIVAVGTSLPEIATSVFAAVRGERDIAVGNAVGSNIFNLLGVLGTLAIVSPEPLTFTDAAVNFDVPLMTAVAVAALPVFITGTVARWQGALFLGYYAAYLGYVVLDASGHDGLEAYSTVMMFFVLPLTASILIAVLLQRFGKGIIAGR